MGHFFHEKEKTFQRSNQKPKKEQWIRQPLPGHGQGNGLQSTQREHNQALIKEHPLLLVCLSYSISEFFETVTFFIGGICYGVSYLSGMTRYDMVCLSVWHGWRECVAGAYILSSFVSGYKDTY